MDGPGFWQHCQPATQQRPAAGHGHDVAGACDQPADLGEHRCAIDVDVQKVPVPGLRIRFVFQMVMFAGTEHQRLTRQNACPRGFA